MNKMGLNGRQCEKEQQMKLCKLGQGLIIGSYAFLTAITVLAQDELASDVAIDASPDTAAIAAADAAAAAVMQQPIVDYQNCIKNVIANDVAMADKRVAIALDCDSERRALQAVLPTDFGDFLLLNMDRRINMILTAMQDAERVVADMVEDAEEIIDEISDK
jgi:hypothetical protein